MRVAIYERVSTEEQAVHGLSIEAQDAALRAWVENNNHTLVGVFVDAGISARKAAKSRPELQRLLQYVEAGRVDLIIFTKLDRWFRNIREYYKVDEILTAHNVAWQAIHEDYETATANGRLKLNILLSVAEQEADRTSERIKTVFAQKKAKGEWVAGNAPFGMKLVDKHLAPDENAEKVRALFDAFLATRSTRETTRVGYRMGMTHSINSVKGILQNERYVTVGIIDEATFSQVQAVYNTRSQRNSGGTNIYLFSGLVFCGECGHRCGVRTLDKKYIYYYCAANKDLRGCSVVKTTREEIIEQYLLENIVAKCDALRVSSAPAKKVNRAAVTAKMERLTEMYILGRIQKDRYDAEYSELEASLVEEPVFDEEVILDALQAYDTLDKKGKKEFWSRIIKRIDISANGEISFDLNFTII